MVSVDKYLCFFLFLLCVFVCSCSTKEVDESFSLAVSVGETSVTVESVNRQFGDKIKDSISVYRFLSDWVEKELLYQGGLSLGVGAEASVLQKTSNYRKDLVGSVFLDRALGGQPIVEDDVKKYYTENKNEYKRKEKEVLVSYFISQDHSEALKIKKELKRGAAQKLSKTLSKYNGVRKTFSFGGFPSKINDSVFNKKNFKKGNILGPYSINNNYYIIKIEKVFQKGSYVDISFVFNEIYQRLKNLAMTQRRRELVDSLWGVFPVAIDSQKIRGLIN